MAVSTPSIAEAIATLKAVVNFFQQNDLHLNANSSNIAGLLDTLKTTLNGERSAEIEGQINQVVSSLTRPMTDGQVRSALVPAMQDVMLAINKPDLGFVENCHQLNEYMIANSDSFNSSNITHGSPSAGGSNVGNGNVYRLTVSENADELEALHFETKTATCLSDESSNEKNRERWQIKGQRRFDSFGGVLEVAGSGVNQIIRTISADETAAFVQNPYWLNPTGTQPVTGTDAAPSTTTEITGWTLSAAANFELTVDTTYTSSPAQSTARSLRFLGNGNITQQLNSTKKPNLDLYRPLFVGVPVYRESNCDGTFTQTIGGDAKATTVTGLSNAAWTFVTHDLDSGRYFKNYNAANLSLTYTLGSRTTGSLLLGWPVIAYFSVVDGTFLVIVGGSTPFLVDDLFTIADSLGSRGIMKYWLEHRSGLVAGLGGQNRSFSFASDNAGTETFTDPS